MVSLSFIAVGAFTAAQARTIAEASKAAGRSTEFVELLEDASVWNSAAPVAGLLLDENVPDLTQQVLKCRLNAALGAVPILVLVAEPSDLGFNEAFSWGADDLVARSFHHGLVRRFRSLPTDVAGELAPERGGAVVAFPDRSRRIVMGRILRNARYTVSFAAEAEELARHAADALTMLLVDSALTHDPRELIGAAQRSGSTATWVISAPPKALSRIQDALRGVENAVVVDGYGPPENVLFAYNEMQSGGRTDQRSSPRLLYGTTVAFRPEGQEVDDHAFSYNVSEGGLYVRTLAIPERDTLWLELVPPRTDRRVRLVAEIAWRCPFHRSGQATTPPGFGVRIVDGAQRDLAAWRNGCGGFSRAFS
jgi:DNA-binding response OmpR family regulator